MNSIDIVIGTLLVIGLIRGLWRGLIIEAASLLAIILGIYGAIHFSFYVGNYLQDNLDWSTESIESVAFIATLFGIMIIVMILGKILTKILKIVALGFLNRILGGIFGVLKVGVIIGALLLFLSRTQQTLNWLPEKALETSYLYSPIRNIGELVYANVLKKTEAEIIIPPNKMLSLPDNKEIENDDLPPESTIENIKSI